MKSILEYGNMPECMELENVCDLDVLKARLERLSRDQNWVEATTMPKLHTFIQIHDLTETKILVHKNLSRNQCSLLTKLKCGVPPLSLETGRYKDVPLDKRICYTCNMGFFRRRGTHAFFMPYVCTCEGGIQG